MTAECREPNKTVTTAASAAGNNRDSIVLLTGATGYLGSRLASRLIADGMLVVVAKRSFSDLRRIKSIIPLDLMFDIDRDPLERAFTRFGKISAVVHCATDYGRKASAAPAIVEANLMLPLQLLHLAVKHDVPLFVNSDTFLDKRVSEYSLSKKQFLDWLRLHSPHLVCRSLRLEHFYGPGDDCTKFVAWLVSQFVAGVPEIHLTPGEQKRDFVYIDDVVEAFRVVIRDSMHRPPGFLEFDVGSGRSISIRTLVEELQSLFPGISTTPVFGALPCRHGEIMDSSPDISRLQELGWQPRVSLKDGLASTVKAAKAPRGATEE